MKDYIKASLGSGLCAGVVYTIGAYLGYRAGKAKGARDTRIEYIAKQLVKDVEKIKEQFPGCGKDEES